MRNPIALHMRRPSKIESADRITTRAAGILANRGLRLQAQLLLDEHFARCRCHPAYLELGVIDPRCTAIAHGEGS